MAVQEIVNLLHSVAFQPMPLGSIKPLGWLKNQLRIQADGLTGHLDEFWPDIKESGWIGGNAEGWERAPYWLDGLVPLAFLLDDERLKKKVHRWMDYILLHQQEDGWLGPIQDMAKGKYRAYDPWPVYVFLKAAVQYYEATNDDRVPLAVERFLQKLDKLLDEVPLFVWGQSRWGDLVLSIHWLYERSGEEWLSRLAQKVHDQSLDWQNHFLNFPYLVKLTRQAQTQASHVVNNAMAVKYPGIWFRQTQGQAEHDTVYHTFDILDRYHGQVTGVFTGDEHLAGLNPSQGTELCAVAEYMFSLEVLLSILGDSTFGDRLERIAFNAWPATFKPDMWAHQYDQQVNQVVCKTSEDRIYTTNGKDSNLFGLEPNFGCCTANMHQGWPKFASHLWMKTREEGIAAVAYAPSQVTVEVKGVGVQIELNTDYPFGEALHFGVKTDIPVQFPLQLRIPAWCDRAEAVVDGRRERVKKTGQFLTLEQDWNGDAQITLRLPLKPKVERRYHNSVAVTQGPLIYSLKMGEDWRQIKGEMPHADWEVYPTMPWNYGLELDLESPGKSIQFEFDEVGERPFSPDGAPVRATVKGRRVPAWQIEHNAAGPLPQSPVKSSEPQEELILIPYGCTNLRVTEFPLLKQEEEKIHSHKRRRKE